jgi:leucine dehydrogenase
MMNITPLDVPGYEKVARAEDPESGLVAFIAVHNTALGPALGGMRLWNYRSEDSAQWDVLRLARGMTFKSAVARTGLGGGKSVILADPADKSEVLFEAMGRFVDTFSGMYITAEDVNVGVADLLAVKKQTEHVTGLPQDLGGSGNPSPYTARGTFVGIQATVQEAFGSADLDGRVVALQGAGSVGFVVGQMLKEQGAKLFVSDVNLENVERAREELGAEIVEPADIYSVECDVYSPNALGATLNDKTIPKLKCKVVAGAANNQLEDEDRHAEMLKARGILYAPDYVINAGGIINVSLELQPGGYDEPAACLKIDNIGRALTSVYETAKQEGITTHAAAQEVAEAVLAEVSATQSSDPDSHEAGTRA